MRDWYRVARVRAGDAPQTAQGPGRVFSGGLTPWRDHRLVRRLGPDAARELSRRALGRYLHATRVLELKVVTRVAVAIAFAEHPVRFDDVARLDAHKIHCDEGYHALIAMELMQQLVPDHDGAAPAFLQRLASLSEAHARSADDAALLALWFTVVSETVLSANLTTLSRDADVAPAVRQFVADHAADEAWHATFFSARLADGWRQLAPADRDRWGPVFPALIEAFLLPDDAALATDLSAVGLGRSEVDEVLAHCLSRLAGPGRLRDATRQTLAALERAGALTGVTADAFAGAGLLAGVP